MLVTTDNNQQLIPTEQTASLAAVSAALAGSLATSAAPPAATLIAAGAQNPSTSGNTALDALMLSGTLANYSNLTSTAALSSLLTDMTAAQLAGLSQGNAAGLSNVGFGALGQGAAGVGVAGDDDADGKQGQSGNKQLSSRYRGVCWNKKNKRWQAAINSGGKYIYLGSFTSEDDAAKQFDRAAIKIRGKKAKLNFAFADYVDAEGNLLEDVVLPTGTSGKDERPGATARASHGGRVGYGGDGTPLYFDTAPAGVDIASTALLQAANGAGWTVESGLVGIPARTAKGVAVLNMNDVRAMVPKGCTVECMLPGVDGCMFGAVYKNETTGQRGCGLYTGYKFYPFGGCQNEQDLQQLLVKSMEMLQDDRQIRIAGPTVAAAAAPSMPAGSRAENPEGNSHESLMAALGLSGLAKPGVVAGASNLAAGLFNPMNAAAVTAVSGDGSSRVVGLGMGDLAKYNLAEAKELARKAAEQQGATVTMSYPPLTVSLPIEGQHQQQANEAADLQHALLQVLQQSDAKQQQQQQEPAGDNMLAKLGNIDMATLQLLIKQPQQPSIVFQQLAEQQQQQLVVSSNAATGNAGAVTMEELLAGIGARPAAAAAAPAAAPAAPASVALAASTAPSWSSLVGMSAQATPAAAENGGSSSLQDPNAAADGPAAKRMRLSDPGAAPAAAGEAAAVVDTPDGSQRADVAAAGLQAAMQQIVALQPATS